MYQLWSAGMAVHSWWQQDVTDAHKGPLLLAFVAFVLTFVATRTITRLIRAGRGPFHNLSDGGVHLHHSTPGVFLLVSGGFLAVGIDGGRPGNYISAVLVGAGASLVLDEFAMIFHLQDDYWSAQGQLSVNMVTLTAACVALPLIGSSPFGTGASHTAQLVRGGVVIALLVHLALVVVTALKGKSVLAVLGVFVSPVAWAGAQRRARPPAPWARWL